VTGADEPKAAILGRTEYEIMAPKEAESRGDMTGIERRDIGPDEHHRTGRAGSECAAHADPEIARALPNRLYPAAPITGTAAGPVGRHRDPQPPTPVPAQTAQQQRDHRPLEAERRDITYFAREATFPAAEQRRADKQNESAPHQP
jgi:hypothetical protein